MLRCPIQTHCIRLLKEESFSKTKRQIGISSVEVRGGLRIGREWNIIYPDRRTQFCIVCKAAGICLAFRGTPYFVRSTDQVKGCSRDMLNSEQVSQLQMTCLKHQKVKGQNRDIFYETLTALPSLVYPCRLDMACWSEKGCMVVPRCSAGLQRKSWRTLLVIIVFVIPLHLSVVCYSTRQGLHTALPSTKHWWTPASWPVKFTHSQGTENYT